MVLTQRILNSEHAQLSWHLREAMSETDVSDVDGIAAELLRRGFLVQIRDGSIADSTGRGPSQPLPQLDERGCVAGQAGQQKELRMPGARRDCLKDLRGHRFMTCTGFQGNWGGDPSFLAEPLIVEPRFRDQFAIKFGAAVDTSYQFLLSVG